MYILYVNFSVPASVWVPVFVPSTTLHVFVCTPSQMVTLCLFWCPVNTRTLDDCRFSFPWVQVSVSQTTEYCLYCGLLPCTHSSALCLGHALGKPFYTLFYRKVTSCIENCVFRRDYSRGRCHGHARLCFSVGAVSTELHWRTKFVRFGAHVGAVVLQLADLRRLSLSHTWLYSALTRYDSSSALFDATPACPHTLSGPVLHTYVSDSSTQSPDALFSIVLKPPAGVFFDHWTATDRLPTGYRPATVGYRPATAGYRPATKKKKKKKKKKKFSLTPEECQSCSLQTEFPTWRLGDADRALKFFGTRATKWGLYVCLSIYNTMDTQHLNDDYTSGCDVYGGAT